MINRSYPHTISPWKACQEMLSPVGLHVAGRMPSIRHGDRVLAHAHRFLDYRLEGPVCQEAEANARLISKAPDMEALIIKYAHAGDEEARQLLQEIFDA